MLITGWFLLLFGTSVSHSQVVELKPEHGGQIIKKSGLSYEVVRKNRKIIVYPLEEKSRIPNQLILKFKNSKGESGEMKLTLLPIKEQGMNIYSAPVPAKVYFAGGVSFDLTLSPKK